MFHNPAGARLPAFPVYQIDFHAENSGKRIATTKRKVRWRFGFPNRDALGNGETGTDCRGEEHEVILVWSITSGKRQIRCDGQEVHYASNRAGIVDFSWPCRGNHVIKVVAHASPPMQPTPGFHQYNLLVDGQSFFSMPKLYELGVKGPIQAEARVPGVAVGQSSSLNKEEEDLQRAIALSIQESRSHLAQSSSGRYLHSTAAPVASAPQTRAATAPADLFSAPTSGPQGDLLSMENPAPLQVAAYDTLAPPQAPSYPQQMAQPPSQQQYGTSGASSVSGNYGVQNALTVVTNTGPAPSQYASPQHAGDASIASFMSAPQPLPPSDDPFAPKPPTKNEILNEIMGAYGSGPAPVGQAPVAVSSPNASMAVQQLQTTPQTTNVPAIVNREQPSSPAAADGNFAQPTSAPRLTMDAPLQQEPQVEQKVGVDAALQKLVNFDNIDQPAQEHLTLTMKPKEDKRSNNTKAIPPRAAGMNSSATLEQIKTSLPPPAAKDPQSIMSAPPQLFHPQAVNAGALVVHGEGPPPLQQGFGVGAQMHNNGYGSHPQQPSYAPPQAQYAYRNY
mmetsp:Transcript_16211/g.22613  ORF Transcript_16211/g.22613 Transcript_16211/m.22613 type:complete len:562 (-) Transcript_16211:302-1987(-)